MTLTLNIWQKYFKCSTNIVLDLIRSGGKEREAVGESQKKHEELANQVRGSNCFHLRLVWSDGNESDNICKTFR